MAEHISKQFDLELETIRTRVLQMGGLVEAQMIAAIEALLASDLDALEQVIRDDALVNAMEVSLDEECQHIIARRQPAAATRAHAVRSKQRLSAPAKLGSVSGNRWPISPKPAAPSRASVMAWSRASASECPLSPRRWGMVTPPKIRGRPSTKAWMSQPCPIRSAFIRFPPVDGTAKPARPARGHVATSL